MARGDIPWIVQQAMTETLVDIGQFSNAEKYQLNKYVKLGYLSKGKGGPLPKLKTMYARPDFDFTAAREREVASAMAVCEMEERLRLGPYSPIFAGGRVQRARRRRQAITNQDGEQL